MTPAHNIPLEAIEALPLRDAFRQNTALDRVTRYEGIIKFRGKVVSLWSMQPDPPRFHDVRMPGLPKIRSGPGPDRQTLHNIEMDGLFGMLRRGELAAWGRLGSPIGPWEQPPAEAWAALWIDDLEAGTVKGEGVALFDVRVGTALSLSTGPISGAPGRPSSMHIVLEEHERRRKAGTTEPSRQKEGGALELWLKNTHPHAPRLTGKTIRTKLPDDFRPNV